MVAKTEEKDKREVIPDDRGDIPRNACSGSRVIGSSAAHAIFGVASFVLDHGHTNAITKNSKHDQMRKLPEPRSSKPAMPEMEWESFRVVGHFIQPRHQVGEEPVGKRVATLPEMVSEYLVHVPLRRGLVGKPHERDGSTFQPGQKLIVAQFLDAAAFDFGIAALGLGENLRAVPRIGRQAVHEPHGDVRSFRGGQ